MTTSSYYIIFLLVAIVVFIWVYPKLQLMFNRELLYISPGSWSDKYIPKRVVIVGLIRDAGDRIDTLSQNVETVGGLFDDYRVLVVENDSIDTTRQGLLRWVETNPKVTILGCGYDVKECHIPKASKTIKHSFDRERIEKMVRLRNIYWREIQRRYSDYDYVIVWDFDIMGSIGLDGIADSISLLEEDPEISLVCANGIKKFGPFSMFYDTYALMHPGEHFNIDMKIAHDIRKGLLEKAANKPYLVDSCFSGFAIYRTWDFVNGQGYSYPSENLECEHVTFNKGLAGKKIVNPHMVNLVLSNP